MKKVRQELDTARAEVANLISECQTHERELKDEGISVEDTIADLNKELGQLKRLAAKAERVHKQHVRECARIARTDSEYFSVICKLMNVLSETCPEHPLLRDWFAVRGMWQAQLAGRN